MDEQEETGMPPKPVLEARSSSQMGYYQAVHAQNYGADSAKNFIFSDALSHTEQPRSAI